MGHIRDDCPLTEIDCKHKNIGCQNVVGNSFQFILNCRFGRKVVRLCCIFMSSCKMNYNGLSNVYTFLPFVGFKKFFLTSAPIELYCTVLEGTIKSTIRMLRLFQKSFMTSSSFFQLQRRNSKSHMERHLNLDVRSLETTQNQVKDQAKQIERFTFTFIGQSQQLSDQSQQIERLMARNIEQSLQINSLMAKDMNRSQKLTDRFPL